MAKIERKSSELIEGITGVASGSIQVLEFTRKGVIRGLSRPIKVKRPNQYKK